MVAAGAHMGGPGDAGVSMLSRMHRPSRGRSELRCLSAFQLHGFCTSTAKFKARTIEFILIMNCACNAE